MKLTKKQAVEAYQALGALKGYPKIVRQNNEDQIVTEPFKLSADTRTVIARNKIELRVHVDNYQEAQNELIESHQGEKKGEVAPENMKAFRKAVRELQDETLDVDLKTIKLPDFKLDDNIAINGDILESLDVLIEKQ